ncbi:MAG: PAS domain-containing sensor histidine kinase, partial [Proteobacteria bacterium]
MGLRLFVFLLGAALLASLLYWQSPSEEGAVSGNSLLVYALVNLNIVILCVLAFLIGRNLFKLVFDRRRNILGSRLRSRLVIAFVGLTLVPVIILFVM